MGREIRRVPPNWQHPKSEDRADRDQPMYDRHYDDAKAEWIAGLMKWEAGEDPTRLKYPNDDGTLMDYWEWYGNPPERAYYRPWRDHEATWYQLWQTVSEGTPVSPPFATQEELIAHLAAHGDGGWGASGPGGWGEERARRFVMGDGWAPSMVLSGNRLMTGVEFVTEHPSEPTN